MTRVIIPEEEEAAAMKVVNQDQPLHKIELKDLTAPLVVLVAVLVEPMADLETKTVSVAVAFRIVHKVVARTNPVNEAAESIDILKDR